MTRSLCALFGLAGGLLLSFQASPGADLWVSPVGSHATIGAALGAANAGDRILVEQGTYFENVTLVNAVQLLGGYAPGDSSNRSPATFITTIHGGDVGAAVTSGPEITSSTVVDGFVLRGGGGSPGAGVVVNGGAPVFSGNEISNNTGGLAGGAYIFNGSSARFESNLFLMNQSAGSGGGLRVEQSSIEVIGNTFDSNTAPNAGGGLYVFESAIYCSSNVFRDCQAGDGGGGGAYFQRATTGVQLIECTFTNCDASRGGGLLLRDDSFVQISDSVLDGCDASRASNSTGLGGGACLLPLTSLLSQNTIYRNCTAVELGGGIYALQADLQVLGDSATVSPAPAQFENCTAVSGGGIALIDCEDAIVNGVRFTDCMATGTPANVRVDTEGKGGGLFLNQSNVEMTKSVLEGCSAADGGAFCTYSDVSTPRRQSRLECNTIYGCSATDMTFGSPGVILTQGNRSGSSGRILQMFSNIIAETQQGSGLRCLLSATTSGASRPQLFCNAFCNAAANASPNVSFQSATRNECRSAFTSTNSACDGGPRGTLFYGGPQFCDTATYRLMACADNDDYLYDCSLAPVECGESRGATQEICACPFVSVEETNWSTIKSRYR